MTSQDFPCLSMNGNDVEDRATAAVLAGGGADGVPAFALRQWRTRGNSTAPVFVTWLPGAGRFCLTVKYGLYSLRDGEWYMDTRAEEHAVSLGPGPAGGPQGQRGAAAAAWSQRARGAGSGVSRHGAGPAHGAPGQPGPCAPALGPGALRCPPGRGQRRPALSPAADRKDGSGRDIRTAEAALPRRRRDVARPGSGNPVCPGSLTVVMASLP